MQNSSRPAGSGYGRSIGVLIASNLFGGVGVAAGISAGGLLAEELASTAWAGVAQGASTLGAAIAAVPLANVAVKHGRRRALSSGYFLATSGAVVIALGGGLGNLGIFLLGMALFGIAQAVNLQSRYAAAENVTLASRARGMSLVLWATTVGSVAGPNLLSPGDDFGLSLGLPRYTGSFLFSVVAFALAGVVLTLLFRATPQTDENDQGNDSDPGDEPRAGQESNSGVPEDDPAVARTDPMTARQALQWAAREPIIRFAVVLIALAHAVMVMVMVMTPVHMEGQGDTLELIGITVSLHVVGMYALSPLFGWAIDRFGAGVVAVFGIAVELLAVATGFAGADGNIALTVAALILLGVGWSASVLSGSALVATIAPPFVRVPLQGGSDAFMNYAGAAAAVAAGPILMWGGFHAVNVVAAAILIPAIVLYVPARKRVKSMRGS